MSLGLPGPAPCPPPPDYLNPVSLSHPLCLIKECGHSTINGKPISETRRTNVTSSPGAMLCLLSKPLCDLPHGRPCYSSEALHAQRRAAARLYGCSDVPPLPPSVLFTWNSYPDIQEIARINTGYVLDWLLLKSASGCTSLFPISGSYIPCRNRCDM